ncbi:MAG: C-GCAxxG-C-C family protein [Bacteroidia bacterium]|nr:C-GCAxxG-C-C family protein [Bacteroidia bacterium]
MTDTTSLMGNGSPAPVSPVLSYKTKSMYRRRGLSNLLKMGHCAPAVMQTILDLGNTKEEWLVRMTAGLPGGIGNTGFECGGITSPLIQLGLKYGLSAKHDELPTVIYAGHDYDQQFRKCNNALLCKEILGDRRVPLPCIKVVRHAPELYRQTDGKDNTGAISGETREAFGLLYSHLSCSGFHCAHAVLKHLDNTIPVTRELLDGTSGFIGGTVFKGLTCSAFTAGVMAVGLKLGEIEDSYLRVVRMLATMIVGGNALADHMNKFNRTMNIGNRMSKWFTKEFRSTLCREVTQCDFSSLGDVQLYIDKDSVATCKIIAEKVARQAEMIIKQKGTGF